MVVTGFDVVVVGLVVGVVVGVGAGVVGAGFDAPGTVVGGAVGLGVAPDVNPPDVEPLEDGPTVVVAPEDGAPVVGRPFVRLPVDGRFVTVPAEWVEEEPREEERELADGTRPFGDGMLVEGEARDVALDVAPEFAAPGDVPVLRDVGGVGTVTLVTLVEVAALAALATSAK